MKLVMRTRRGSRTGLDKSSPQTVWYRIFLRPIPRRQLASLGRSVGRDGRSTAQIIPSQEARTLLEKLTPEERDYVLFCLVSEKVDAEHLGAKVPVCRPDGTGFGLIHPTQPPSLEERAVMLERARRMTSASGRSARDLLERMKAGDEDAVRKYIKE